MRIALAQINSGPDAAENLALVREYTARAAAQGARLVVFPEATMRAFGHRLTDIAEPVDGPWADAVRQVAADHDVTVVVGMFTPGADGKVRNTLLATGRGVEAHYDKIHLYDAFGFAESDTVDAGDAPVTFTVDDVTVGLATCYDVRFPALFTRLATEGAQLIAVCASWGAGPTKTEQWDLLVRARALDATAYVAAAGQADPAVTGVPVKEGAPTGVGHSALVDPLGFPVATLDGRADLLIADVDPGVVARTRRTLPVLANARL
ncbi:apolipoprotein acyltransferase [Tersicoccus solisilvae]|uniref:Apolipoprotein acyltransferase n=1 Tax=Tersicoccus solisilvae TaxID=1882339 RepID=A0ABQ1P9I0_9MICC|nr:carbon-nitrogen hydrolase family protein [Tersicoccus solisilvae]GGC93860.1 apolipoprotein acyltransferase [Tersicoccus solisilvae]